MSKQCRCLKSIHSLAIPHEKSEIAQFVTLSDCNKITSQKDTTVSDKEIAQVNLYKEEFHGDVEL